MRSHLMHHYILMVFVTIGLICNANAQDLPIANANNALAVLKSDYYKQTANQLRLYNGIKYVDYNVYYTGNGYFKSNTFQNATLYYDGGTFENVPTLYDMYRELVVVRYKDTSDKISLSSAKLDSFVMSGHRFIRIDAGTGLAQGFYELLYNGKTRLLKKYAVNTEDDKSGTTVKHQFYQTTVFYVLKNGVYSSVAGVSSLRSRLKDKRKQLNEYLNTNKPDGNQPEEEMIKLLIYYDKLSG